MVILLSLEVARVDQYEGSLGLDVFVYGIQ